MGGFAAKGSRQPHDTGERCATCRKILPYGSDPDRCGECAEKAHKAALEVPAARYVVAAWVSLTGSRPTGRRLGAYGERLEYEPAPEAHAVVWTSPATCGPGDVQKAREHLETSQGDAALRRVYCYAADVGDDSNPLTRARAEILAEHEREASRSARLDAFMRAYVPALEAAREADPERYAFPASGVPLVAARIREAFARGSFNKGGAAIRAACRAVGIRHTYAAIKSYLDGGTK